MKRHNIAMFLFVFAALFAASTSMLSAGEADVVTTIPAPPSTFALCGEGEGPVANGVPNLPVGLVHVAVDLNAYPALVTATGSLFPVNPKDFGKYPVYVYDEAVVLLAGQGLNGKEGMVFSNLLLNRRPTPTLFVTAGFLEPLTGSKITFALPEGLLPGDQLIVELVYSDGNGSKCSSQPFVLPVKAMPATRTFSRQASRPAR